MAKQGYRYRLTLTTPEGDEIDSQLGYSERSFESIEALLHTPQPLVLIELHGFQSPHISAFRVAQAPPQDLSQCEHCGLDVYDPVHKPDRARS